MKKIVVNGANGYVGSNFIHQLLKEGYSVIALVRTRDEEPAFDRMLAALREKSVVDELSTENLEVYPYRLLDENFALPPDILSGIFSGEVDYFHFAASLKFDARSREEIFAINLDGLRNSIEIFLRYTSAASRFFFIGTAYSCGILDKKYEEEFYENKDIEHFRNYYEQSKRYGENLVREYIEHKNLDAHIIRLSQVVGDKKTGVTNTDYGIFDFAKKIQELSRQHPGEEIRVIADPVSTQNLIPIDTVVADLIAVLESEEVPDIMNFVSKKPMTNYQILEILNELLPVKLIPQIEVEEESMNRLERAVAAGMSFTGSYIDTNIDFDTAKRDSVIRSKNHVMDRQAVYDMLSYYLHHRTNG